MALALGCLLGKVFGILEGFGAFAGWQTAALKAHRKPLLWPWPWGGLEGLEGFGGFAGWQTAALKANRKPLLWPWPWGACSGSGLGPGVPAGDGVWRVCRVLEGFGGFAGWQTAALKAYRKPLLWPWLWGACSGSGLGPGVPVREGVWNFGGVWSVCGLANGSFESP